jgi:hypothetical protein
MNIALLGKERIGDDLLALHRIIHHQAPHCGLDTADAASVRRFIDGTYPPRAALNPDFLRTCREMRAMLILLLRLEASTSEDLGFEAVCRLWRHHDEILARYRIPDIHHEGMAPDAMLAAPAQA